MVHIWSIGERKFGGDFRRRMIMFNSMVKSVCMYAVEIWGAEERSEEYTGKIPEVRTRTRKMQNRIFVKKGDKDRKNYKRIVKEGERVIKYEEKMKRMENEILKQYWHEIGKES